MRNGFVRVAAVSPRVKVADVEFNVCQIKQELDACLAKGAGIVVFPELSLTGYSCGDLFYQATLLKSAKEALLELADYTQDKEGLVFVGLPFESEGKLYNVAAAISDGEVIGIVPKKNIPTYGWAREGRYFAPGKPEVEDVVLEGATVVPFGMNQIFTCSSVEGLAVACEICEDLWVPNTPSTEHALAGANVIVNLAASNEIAGKGLQLGQMVAAASDRLKCAYVFASAGAGESTQDIVYGGRCFVAESGELLAAKSPYEAGFLQTEVDVEKLRILRRRMSTFEANQKDYVKTSFYLKQKEVGLTGEIAQNPFVPKGLYDRESFLGETFETQARGLAERYRHIGCKSAVIGISGGLDSTLALLVAVRAFDILELDRKGIYAVTMPCFGTTDRTYNNACKLSELLGVTLREVDIKGSVISHFEDIGQDPDKHDVTYENAQARERTQVLMDLANMVGGLVIGTGDLSELVLGWATYNGDHMSMYSVNGSVPKTMVRLLVKWCAEQEETVRDILEDVLDTPVSPELLPASGEDITQKTEDLVGPYELHDFFLYYILSYGFGPSKVYALAKAAFAGVYENKVIHKWLKTFYKRFFAQQFKRSCLPDGPMVTAISVSPRCGLHMPSDANVSLWMKEMDALED